MTSRLRALALFAFLLGHRETSAQTVAMAGPHVKGLRCMARGESDIDPTSLRLSTGTNTLDSFLDKEAAALVDLLGVTPVIGYVDALGWDNAAASEEPFDPLTTGTVYIGLELLRTEIQTPGRGRHSVAGVLAHEFAHILQFKREGAAFSDPLETELHADYMAGYYLGRRNQLTYTEVEALATTLFVRGDPEDFFEAPDHGTGYQRVAVMLAGYQARSLAPDSAYQAGRTVASGFNTIVENSTQYPLLSKQDADLQWTSQVKYGDSRGVQLSQGNVPYFRYSARMHNLGEEPLVVALVVELVVVPINSPDGKGAQPLARRVVQRRILPQAFEDVVLVMRGTTQLDVVETRLQYRLLVKPESALVQPQTLESTGEAAVSLPERLR
jgi:hypothetical protein